MNQCGKEGFSEKGTEEEIKTYFLLSVEDATFSSPVSMPWIPSHTLSGLAFGTTLHPGGVLLEGVLGRIQS